MAKAIAFLNRKGGSGKTTSCVYTGSALLKAGHKVAGLDADPDQDFFYFGKNIDIGYPVYEAEKDMESQVEALKKLDSHIIIDTPPNDANIILDVADFVDIVVIPLAPSGFDFNRVLRTLKAVAKVEKYRGVKLAHVLLTSFNMAHSIDQDAVSELQNLDAPLLEARVRDLTRYKAYEKPTYLDEYEAVLQELGVL